jgi:hypothetical protein
VRLLVIGEGTARVFRNLKQRAAQPGQFDPKLSHLSRVLDLLLDELTSKPSNVDPSPRYRLFALPKPRR